jgi:myb proto-oncogene protein
MTTRAPCKSWTPAEDVQLTRAVTNTPKKRQCIDWIVISAQVPDRTISALKMRWRRTLDLSIELANVCTGTWDKDEDIKLKNAVEKHGGMDWTAIAALVLGRTSSQCQHRWHRILDARVDRTPGCSGRWTLDDDTKLKNAVHKHGGKNWPAIEALVPGRTRSQCKTRWHDVLDPSINLVNRRTGKWEEDEDIKLKNAVHKHGGKDWVAIAALVPDRTMNQCRGRWRYSLVGRMDGSK